MPPEDAIARLARQVDAATKAEQLLNAETAAMLRRQGAAELHGICAAFVSSVNEKLSEARFELSPPVYAPEMFREAGANLLQISTQGRQMQIAFEATVDLMSTEKFAIPYVLEGEIRTYNQRMLERFEIRSRLLFFCVENELAEWRYFDWRTRHTGALASEVLASLMQPLFS